jgi:hypothetical protein
MEHKHSELIEQLGGTGKVAKLCRVRSQAVSKWRRDGIPQARLLFLQAMFPDLFGTTRARLKKVA